MSDSESSDPNNQQTQRKLLELEQQRIKKQLSQLPYAEILKYRQTTNMKGQTAKVKEMKKKKFIPNNDIQKGDAKEIKIMKRPPKFQPKPIFQNDRQKGKDPRFEDYAGNFNADLAKKTYSFISQMQDMEVQELRKKIKDKKIRQDQKGILMKQYSQLRDQMKKNENRELEQKLKASHKKNPNFHLKKKQLKEKIEQGKLNTLNEKDQKKKMNKKEKKIQKRRIIDRKMAMK